MSYRRYPDRERALSRLDRHHPASPSSEFQLRMAEQARTALGHAERELAPFGEAVRQLAVAAPAVLAQVASAASKFVEALKQPARTA